MTTSCVAWYQWVPHDPESRSLLWNKRDKVPWKRSLNLYVGLFVDRICVKGIPPELLCARIFVDRLYVRSIPSANVDIFMFSVW